MYGALKVLKLFIANKYAVKKIFFINVVIKINQVTLKKIFHLVPCGCPSNRINGHTKSNHPHIHSRHRSGHGYESSSMMTSDIESTSFLDSEEETTSRYFLKCFEIFCICNLYNHFASLSYVTYTIVLFSFQICNIYNHKPESNQNLKFTSIKNYSQFKKYRILREKSEQITDGISGFSCSDNV